MPSMAGMFSSIGPTGPLHRLGAALDRQLQRLGGVLDAEGHGVGRGAVRGAERRRLAGRLHVEDEVDVALREAQHVLGAVPGDGREAHQLEQPLQPLRLGRGELDELEAVGAERIVEQVAAHGLSPSGAIRRSPATTAPGSMSGAPSSSR